MRRLNATDAESYAALENACFTRPYSKAQIAEELSRKDAIVLGVIESENLVGALILREIVDEWWVFRVMVLPAFRYRGLARQLLDEAKRIAGGQGKELWLEVSAENPAAIALYQAAGFEEKGRRKAYYPAEKEGGHREDAILMTIPQDALYSDKETALDYELLDSGHWHKLERFGANKVERPDAQADWSPQQSLENWKPDAVCTHAGRGHHTWEKQKSFQEPWLVSYGNLRFELRCSQSKNIGLFPEQEENWRLMAKAIRGQKGRPVSVLNLFAYTGAATLVAAAAGASVCHVDASKSSVKWASRNAELSGLKDANIRWIVDDAVQFLKREARRGNRYDGIVLDPPPFGHAKGKQFVFDDNIIDLLAICRELLSEKPLFFILNSYAMNLTPEALLPLVKRNVGEFAWQTGSLTLKEKARNRALSCSTYVRFFA